METNSPAGGAKMFKGFDGYVQADAKSVYDILFRPPDGDVVVEDRRLEVGCWVHGRRRLWEAAIVLKSEVAREGRAATRAREVRCGLTNTACSSSVTEVTKLFWGKIVDKQLERVPDIIARKFRIWVALVEESGIREVRKCRGFHDEPLKGRRHGQRSVRLNRAYRAIYVEHETGEVELIEVLEVNKHEYR